MANIDKMKEEFDKLLKKYESAATVREWQNAAAGVQYDENISAVKTEVNGFRNRFQKALEEDSEEEV